MGAPMARALGSLGLLCVLAAGCDGVADPTAVHARDRGVAATPTVDAIRRRGFVQCGVSTGIAGFSAPDAHGEWRGLDVDVCRATAAAVLGDASRVRFTPLSAAQ